MLPLLPMSTVACQTNGNSYALFYANTHAVGALNVCSFEGFRENYLI